MIIIQGILLFLFIPVVLFLFLSFPLGTVPSIVIGALIMFGHRFIARPYMLKNINKRCLWSGRLIKGDNLALNVKTKNGDLVFRVLAQKEKTNSIRFFNFIYKNRIFLKAAILGTLLWYLVSLLAGELNSAWAYLSREVLAQIFKVIIAFTVVISSFLYRFGSVSEPVNAVFPAHNFFLLGIRWILWIFRIVGTWWLTQWLLGL